MTGLNGRLRFFDSFSLQSLENNITDELYFCIFINRSVPVKAKRELNSILERSRIRGYVYVIEIDFPNEVKPKSKDFIVSHATDGERVMQTRLDMDDGYAKGFLEEIDIFDNKNNHENGTTLYSFSLGYRFAIDMKKAIPWDIDFRGLNMFLYSSDRSISIWVFNHPEGGKYGKKMGWDVICDKTLAYRWYRAESADNTDVTVWKDKYERLEKQIESEGKSVLQLREIEKLFSLSEIRTDAFYKLYPSIPYTNSILIYDTPLMRKCTMMERDRKRLVDIYVESGPRNINEKPKTAWNIRLIEKENGCSFLRALEKIYDLPRLVYTDYLEKIGNLKEIVKAILLSDVFIFIAGRGKGVLETMRFIENEFGFCCEKNESAFGG